MRKIKEVLRLHSLGLAQRQIARSCSIGQSTVSEYLKAAETAGLKWPDIADWDDARIAAALLPGSVPRPARSRLPEPDYTGIHAELQKHKHLTLQLVWEEYRAVHPGGYGYSRFCELYQRWRRAQEVVLRQEHRAGTFFTAFVSTTHTGTFSLWLYPVCNTGVRPPPVRRVGPCGHAF
jgi:hypothetical protein